MLNNIKYFGISFGTVAVVYLTFLAKKLGIITALIILFVAVLNATKFNAKYYCHKLLYPNKRYYEVLPEVKDITFEQAMSIRPRDMLQIQQSKKYHPIGVEVTKLRSDLKEKLVQLWQSEKHRAIIEEVGDCNTGTKYSSEHIQKILFLEYVDPHLQQEIADYLHPILEKWSNSKLTFNNAYGFREYLKGSALRCHVDKYQTHVISVIINVDQKVWEPWPLVIWDHNQQKHEVALNDGYDMVFYESSSCMHGRPYTLKGDSFVNIFFHFTTEDWNESKAKITQAFNEWERERGLPLSS